MSPTFIGPELEKTGKLAKTKSVNEEKETAGSNEEKETVESKVDNVKEDWSYITSIKDKGDIFNASITSIKKGWHSQQIRGIKDYFSV